MNAVVVSAAGIACALVLAGCQPAPEKPEPVRPVLTKTMALEAPTASRFAGEIAPRFETSLSFRMFGRVVDRSVEVGDYVKAGQQIAQLDATAQELALRSATANLAAAEAQLTNLLAIEQRQRSLLERNAIADVDFESAEQARRAGQSSVAQAEAQLTKAQEQLGYATLRVDTAGLVTSVEIELGQTVTAGQTVATVVRPESSEAVVSVAEAVVNTLKVGDRFTIVKQVDPSIAVSGTIREIAPQADAATRSVEVRINLVDPPESFKLGSTIMAMLVQPEPDRLVVPATAVVTAETGSSVWVVDAAAQTVAQRSVTATPIDDASMQITAGLAVGDIVVVAGAHSLEAGQPVRFTQGDAP
ncbi:efflux RND transporter periplasmic adaptor subunit [uncultured Devosia sp.]|uniref:efflux RND transporter periplasmic adaptor subunit n=1 Tax=uncultured Devosia sp. TaxID=211434 RepID=UPI0035C9C9B7